MTEHSIYIVQIFLKIGENCVEVLQKYSRNKNVNFFFKKGFDNTVIDISLGSVPRRVRRSGMMP